MIHSLSGGILSDNTPKTIAQVEILGGYYEGTFWFVAPQSNLKINSIVVVPFGKQKLEGLKTAHKGKMIIYTGRLCGHDVILSQSGVGKVNAAIGTQYIIDIKNRKFA